MDPLLLPPRLRLCLRVPRSRVISSSMRSLLVVERPEDVEDQSAVEEGRCAVGMEWEGAVVLVEGSVEESHRLPNNSSNSSRRKVHPPPCPCLSIRRMRLRRRRLILTLRTCTDRIRRLSNPCPILACWIRRGIGCWVSWSGGSRWITFVGICS